MLDIEQLLIQKFLGFYNQKSSDIKQYVYIAWSLWGYLIHKQQSILKTTSIEELPFYSKLPADIFAITLNYTTFLETKLGKQKIINFHGGLNEYVRMDTRHLVPIENIETIDIVKFIQNEIAKNINFASDNHRHVIPSLIPPLRLKPVLSSKYIDIWHDAKNLIHDAQKVVIVGYSLNSADEHFNDIIRNSTNRKYDIVTPDATGDDYMKRVEKVFGVSLDNFIDTSIQGKSAKTTSNIRLIAAKADEINITELFNS